MAIKIRSEWRDKKKGNCGSAGQCAATRLRTGTHLYSYLITRNFCGSMFISQYLARLKFRNFAKILYFESLSFRLFEYNNLHFIGNVI